MIIAYGQTFAQDRLSPLTSNKTREINCVYYSILDKKPDFSYACLWRTLYNKTEQSINPSYLEVITICDLQFSNSLCINSQLV